MSTVNGGWQGPVIVKEGLSLYLDAGSPNSFFNKTGTFIKDMSGGPATGTLLNGVGYLTSNGGVFNFDNTNDYISTNHRFSGNLTELTVSAWVYRLGAAIGNENIVSQGGPPAGNQSTFYFAIINGNRYPGFGVTTDSAVVQPFNGLAAYSLTDNIWTYLTVTVSPTLFSYYTNGVFRTSAARSGLIRKSPANFATTVGSTTYGNQIYRGSIGPIQVYTRALTAAEVSQNYNTTKGRFGL